MYMYMYITLCIIIMYIANQPQRTGGKRKRPASEIDGMQHHASCIYVCRYFTYG